MIEELTVDDLLAQLILLRNVDKRIFMVVEGESDLGTLEPHTDQNECLMIIGHSKPAVLGVVELAEASSISSVLGLVDRDWDGDVLPPSISSNVIYTEHYDLDATIILTTSALTRVISNFCDGQKHKNHMARLGDPGVASLLLRVCAPVGALRRLSAKDSLALSLRNFPIHEVIDVSAGSIDLSRLVSLSCQRSAPIGINEGELLRRLQGQLSEFESVYLTSGHDLLAALSTFSSRWGGKAGAKHLGNALRAAMSCADLVQTRLYESVDDWARSKGRRLWNCDVGTGAPVVPSAG